LLLKEDILTLIAEEKDQFNQYIQLCAHYNIQIDPIAAAMSKATVGTLNQLLVLLTTKKN
jgi:hypothetical protein